MLLGLFGALSAACTFYWETLVFFDYFIESAVPVKNFNKSSNKLTIIMPKIEYESQPNGSIVSPIS